MPVTTSSGRRVLRRDARARRWSPRRGWPEFQLGENVSLYLIDPKNIGQVVHRAAHGAHRAARRRRRARRAASSRRRASSSTARPATRASATWRSSPTPTGTRSCSTGGTPPVTRAAALERYRELPLPDTTEEPWRFTDLRGFDPDAFGPNGAGPRTGPGTMLDLDVAGYGPSSARAGSRSSGRRRASPSSRCGDHELLGSLVGADDKFTAHNAASWEHGLLVRVPKGVVLEQPLYVRIANSSAGGSLFWRLLVVAEEGSRFIADRGVRVGLSRPCGVLERGGRALRRAGREARVRLAPEPLARDVALRDAPRARRARRRARLGRRRLRLEEGQDAHPERPRRPGRDLARDRRLLRRRHAAPRLRHVPGAHRAAHDLRLRLQGRAARPRDRRCGAG